MTPEARRLLALADIERAKNRNRTAPERVIECRYFRTFPTGGKMLEWRMSTNGAHGWARVSGEAEWQKVKIRLRELVCAVEDKRMGAEEYTPGPGDE